MIVWFLFVSLLFFLNSLRGAPMEDLCLDFTLPGFPDYFLKEGEQNIIVNIHNLKEYVSLLVDVTVKSGIMKQVEAFILGFSQDFDISSLQIFSPQELDYLICRRQEIWEAKSLVDNIKFDHGFTPKSPAIINLLEIMTKFTLDQQHAFCQFVIVASSRLPTGGLAALSPKLTIVQQEVMRKKLLYAILEGCGSFDLS
ncbi:E3 ubiquitin-protein ligase UPL3-like [Hordeum vulgare subsp. vulgare]|uniref:E3 ubiquitin-protein ligase UPL3-like n=1 Tax=Hordeum vulgare subsp. vulgare TaxID=112509 RepID=UPI001D1A493B|nr:E3 ubiquitin-protein ligase UPL3-like [Hordeum vulgare subsp. vulgare]